MRPLLLISFSITNMLALVGVPLATPILPMSKVSISVEEAVVILTLILLGIEIWWATAPTPRTAAHHVANLLLLFATIFELTVLPSARTGLFLVLIVAVGVDLVVGAFITLQLKGKSIWISNK